MKPPQQRSDALGPGDGFALGRKWPNDQIAKFAESSLFARELPETNWEAGEREGNLRKHRISDQRHNRHRHPLGRGQEESSNLRTGEDTATKNYVVVRTKQRQDDTCMKLMKTG